MCHLVRPRSYEKTVLAVLLGGLSAHKPSSTASAAGMAHDQQRQNPQSFQFAVVYTQSSVFCKRNLVILGQTFSRTWQTDLLKFHMSSQKHEHDKA